MSPDGESPTPEHPGSLEAQKVAQIDRALCSVDRLVREAEQIEDLLSGILDEMLTVFAADRAWLLYPCDPRAAEWSVPMERTRPEWPGALALGQGIPMSPDVEELFASALASREAMAFGPGHRELPASPSAQFHIQAQLLVVLRPKRGPAWLLGLHHCEEPVAYATQDMETLKRIGQRVAEALTGLITLRDLETSEQWFRELKEHTTDLLWSASPDLQEVFYVSDAFETITGRSKQELAEPPATWLRWVHSEDQGRLLEAAHSLDRATEIELRIVRPNGELRWLSARTAPVRDEDGQVQRLTGSITDISERKQEEHARALLQEQLAASEQQAHLGRLASGFAHEINNPLTSILGNIGLLLELSEGENTELLRDVLEAAERIRAIARSLEALALRGDPSGQSADLRTVIETSAQSFRNQLQLQGTLSLSLPSLPWVVGDESQFTHIFFNLLLNAKRAMMEQSTRPHALSIRGLVEDGHVVVEVQDNGIGISADKHHQIFDPFYTTWSFGKRRGLGLSHCRSYLSSIGGEIHVESAAGEGALFRLRIPIAARVEVTESRQEHASDQTQPHRVLIVDDDAISRRAILRMLREFRVEAAPGAAEALELLARSRYDIVICDVMMPGMNGVQLYELVRTQNPESAESFVFFTGGVFDPIIEAALAATTRPCLLKPMLAKDMRDFIHDFAARRGQELGSAARS